MRKHGILFAGISAALAVMLCGCANVDGVTPSASSDAAVSAENPSDQSDASVTSADVGEESEFPSKCRIYDQSSKKFTDEQLLDYFDRHPECGTPQKSEHYSDEYHRYEAQGAIGFVSRGNNIYFATDKGSLYDSVNSYLEESYETDKGRFCTDGDLDFASRDEVLEKVQTELSERFGIMPDEWWVFKFNTVKKEGVEEYKKKAYRDAYEPEEIYEGDDLEKEKQYYETIEDLPAEDFYYLDMKFRVDDIPLFMGGALPVGGVESGRTIFTSIFSLVYGKNGIESINISPAYDTDKENSKEAELIPADQARGLIQKKYDGIITTDPPEILDMKLFYLPIPQNDLGEYSQNFELRPYYGFFGTQTEEVEGETYSYVFATYFDAVTGEELATKRGQPDTDASDWGFEV